MRFGREVESFAANLKQLVAITDHANLQRPHRPWGNHADDCHQALQPLSQAVGDFQKTLEECQRVLNDHDRFQRDTAGFIDNVQWHLGSTQRDVDILRARVQFHTTKLHILLKPFELHLLLEIRQELQDLRREVAELKGLLVTVLANGKPSDSSLLADSNLSFLIIPGGVRDRFISAMKKDPPIPDPEPANMPLLEGFDALVYQFARSTVEFNPGLSLSQKVPDDTQFVNLLKSKWIMELLEKSQHFKDTGPASLWASYLRELKSEIIRECRRFETKQLVAPSNDAIIRLPDQCFSIWAKPDPPLEVPDLTEPRPLEDLILKLELPESTGNHKTSLNVFRRSAIESRFVTTTTDLRKPGYHKEKEFIVNTNAMKIIPAYATPDASPDANNILLSSSHVHDLRWQYLSSPVDVFALQQALTGYRVSHYMSNVSWSFNGSSKSGKYGEGKLQLWQQKILPSLVAQSSASADSPKSTISPALRRQSQAFSTATTMLSGSSATSAITGSRGNGTAVLMPEPPVMVLFTSCGGKYAFLYLELDPDTFVNTEKCNCRKNSKKRCHVVILESKAKTIKIRRACSLHVSDKGLYTWDLARFRMPRHPEFGDVEVVPKVKYLRLEFPTVEGKPLRHLAVPYGPE